ncbi:hypothetical protein ANHYDRO_01421 [Anaerococcus hydrogenalis DSM 7454]|uniref:Uncharacterized protein n=1 Tax=Anaerococcus hydrogenalis DSM 7454 TaxID=561177 RepID=B6W9Z5_9FIRM|nr:hypothetical protein [Anaerococcus hydrogenalis]EEB35755.1 hypothetical protein ANHYDRO_01421 [Anaerococcus hydrogenalis DSM 7454]
MKLTNNEIYGIHSAISEIIDQKVSVKTAFKLSKILRSLEDVIIICNKIIKDSNDDEVAELLNEKTEVNIEKIEVADLDEFEISIRNVAFLNPIINQENVESEGGKDGK